MSRDLSPNESRGLSVGPHPNVALAAAIYEGAWRRDADAARRWIAISKLAKARDPWLSQVAVAALHFASGKSWHLDRASRRFDAIRARHPIPVSALLLYTTIERLTSTTGRGV